MVLPSRYFRSFTSRVNTQVQDVSRLLHFCLLVVLGKGSSVVFHKQPQNINSEYMLMLHK